MVAAWCASIGVVLRLGRPLPPGFYNVSFLSRSLRVFNSDHRQRVLNAFFFLTRFFFNAFFSFLAGLCDGVVSATVPFENRFSYSSTFISYKFE